MHLTVGISEEKLQLQREDEFLSNMPEQSKNLK